MLPAPLVAAVLIAAAGDGRAPQRLVMGAGACGDALAAATESLSRELERLEPGSGISIEELRLRLGKGPSPSVAELQKKVELASDLAFRTRFREAEAMVNEALALLRRMPPGPERVTWTVKALEVRGFLGVPLSRPALLNESLRRILLIAPSHKLDDYLFPPPVIDRFEGMRRDQGKSAGGVLRVSSTPPDADVFVDGALKGKTPLELKVTPASYAVEVSRDGKAAVPRTVQVTGPEPATVEVNLAVEGALEVERAPCLTGEERPTLAAKELAKVLELDEAVVVELPPPPTGERAEISATLVDVDRTVAGPTGRIPVEHSLRRMPELARVVLGLMAPTDLERGVPAPVAAKPAAPAPPPFAWPKVSPAVLGLGAVGVGTFAAGTVFAIQSLTLRGQQEAAQPVEVWQLDHLAKLERLEFERRTWSLIAYGVSAATLGTAAWLHYRDQGGPKKITVGPGPGTAGASLTVTFD